MFTHYNIIIMEVMFLFAQLVVNKIAAFRSLSQHLLLHRLKLSHSFIVSLLFCPVITIYELRV